ncbi:hypothetical protein Tco_0675180 [Tanacetum coccineum]
MIAVNNLESLVFPLPFYGEKKKGKPQSMTPTLPKSQCLEAFGLADKGLPSMISDEGTVKTTPLPEGPHGDKDSEGFKPPTDMEPSTTHVVDPLRNDAKYQVDQTQSTILRYQPLTKNNRDTSSKAEPDNQTLLLLTAADVQALLLSDEELIEESEDDVFEDGDEMCEDIHHVDEEETQSPSPNKYQSESSHARDTESDSDSSCPEALKKYDNVLPLTERQLVQYLQKVSQVLYNRLTEDQWEKHKEVVASYANLKSEIEEFHDAAYKVHKGTKAAFSTYEKLLINFQDQYGNDTNKILSSFKVIQDAIKEDLVLNKKASPFRQDDHIVEWAKSLTSMAWNLGPRLTSIERTQFASDLKSILSRKILLRSMINITPPEPQVTQREGKGIVTGDEESLNKAIPTLTVVYQDPDEPIRIPYKIYWKLYNITNDEIQDYLNKEEAIKKKVEQARLLAMTKVEIIKVVYKEAEKARIDPKIIESAKGGEQFKKIQNAEHQVLKREHSQKVKKAIKLRKKRLEAYDRRNFQVHNPFKFSDFGVTELDELGLIIQKKKNKIVGKLMIALGKEREQRMKLEPEIRVPGLECNRSLPKDVPFVNNIVIEEPEYSMFFIDVFGDEAFQRLSDINKVRVNALYTYLVMASNITTPENTRFCLKLRKLIEEHPYQEKLMSKKVKLESSAKKQQSVAKSLAEDEYVAAAGWDLILKGDIELHFIPTKYQLADIFTKPLDEPTFTRLKAELGMLNINLSVS